MASWARIGKTWVNMANVALMEPIPMPKPDAEVETPEAFSLGLVLTHGEKIAFGRFPTMEKAVEAAEVLGGAMVDIPHKTPKVVEE